MTVRDFLPASTPELQVRIVEKATADLGSGEDLDGKGNGTNRSAYCDRINARFGSPLGSYWCANAAAGWWKDAGAPALPPEPGSCESWRQWAFKTSRFRSSPRPGYAVLYGTAARANHITVVARVVKDPTALGGERVLDIGGNTSLGEYNRDGWIVAEKPVAREHLIGYVAPRPEDP
jgi:hypothetical protein